MKVGDLVKLCDSARRNGILAGKHGLIVNIDKHSNPVVSVGGMIKAFHMTQIEGVISESR